MQWANANHLFSPFFFTCQPASAVTPFPKRQILSSCNFPGGMAAIEGHLWQPDCVHEAIHAYNLSEDQIMN